MKVASYKLKDYIHIGSIKEYQELKYWSHILIMRIDKLIQKKSLPSFVLQILKFKFNYVLLSY